MAFTMTKAIAVKNGHIIPDDENTLVQLTVVLNNNTKVVKTLVWMYKLPLKFP